MGMLDRLRERLSGSREPELLTDSPGLVVVVEAFDPAEADSAVLARSPRWRPDRPAVLRHHLVLPPDQVERAAALLAQDGYELRPSDRGPGHLDAVRVQVLDALHCAQERSRMAGLAQRLGGDAPGWDALQPEPA
ncbi:MAG: ribonuclease E inhibitor RraB [Umezawaea sp.]